MFGMKGSGYLIVEGLALEVWNSGARRPSRGCNVQWLRARH